MPMNGKLLNWNFAINGLNIANTSVDTSSINNSSTNNYIGRTNSGTLYSNTMCELIHYPFTLTTIENRRIQSYLAIKWGISIDQTAATNNYTNSSDAIIWDATTANAAGFKHKITGIGRDDNMALYQKQSQSQADIAANTLVTMGIGTIAVSNSLNTNV